MPVVMGDVVAVIVFILILALAMGIEGRIRKDAGPKKPAPPMSKPLPPMPVEDDNRG